MKQNARNVAVGLTVLVALAMFAGMILLFAGLPGVLQSGRLLRIRFPDSAGARAGEWVYMSGMQVGKITDVDFATGDPADGVVVTCRIRDGIQIPGNVQPVLATKAFGGGAYLALDLSAEPRRDPNTGEEIAFLPEDWTQPLQGKRRDPSLLPKELTEGLKGLSKLANCLNDLLAGPEAQPGATRPGATQPAPRKTATFGEALASFKGAMDAIEKTLGDPNNQANFQATLAHLAEASEKAGLAMDELKLFAAAGRTATTQAVGKIGKFADTADRRLNDVADKIVADAEELAKVLATINRLVTKMEAGEGTIPRLVNDPKLYENFTQAAKQLSELAAELRVLVKQWEESGVPLKLK